VVPKWLRAQDTFVADGPDGAPFAVKMGDVFPDNHKAVAEMFSRDPEGAGRLFTALDPGEEEAPAKPKASRSSKGSS